MQSKRARRREGRERTRAKDAAAIFASSSPLFCSVRCLHRPHHRQTLAASPARNIAHGEGRKATPSGSGRCHRHHIATHRRRSTSNQQQGSASTVCHPALLVLVLFLSSGGDGRAASQPGRAIPCRSPRRPSPPCRGRPTSPRLALLEVWRAYSTDPN